MPELASATYKISPVPVGTAVAMVPVSVQVTLKFFNTGDVQLPPMVPVEMSKNAAVSCPDWLLLMYNSFSSGLSQTLAELTPGPTRNGVVPAMLPLEMSATSTKDDPLASPKTAQCPSLEMSTPAGTPPYLMDPEVCCKS